MVYPLIVTRSSGSKEAFPLGPTEVSAALAVLRLSAAPCCHTSLCEPGLRISQPAYGGFTNATSTSYKK
jgi:hypothetical protein